MKRGLTGRMLVASGLLAIVVGGAFAVVLLANSELRGTTDLRRQTREELVAADTLEKQVIDLESGLRGFVITRDESVLEPSNEARAALPDSARALERLAADEPVQRARVRRMARALNAYVMDYALPLVDAVRRGDASASSVARTAAGKRRVDALRAGFNSFREAERTRLAERDADVDTAARRATAAAVVGIGGSIVLILVFAGYLTRVIVQPLRRAAVMADRLAGGDLSARMRETDVAEIGALERSFNVMAGSLETSRDELASLLAEQAALRRVATLVAREASQVEVFTAIAEEIAQLLGTEEIRMLRYEEDHSAVVVGSAGEAKDVLQIGSRQPLGGENATSRVFRTGQPVRIDDYAKASGPIAETVHSIGIRGVVATPVLVKGRLWGAIAAGTTQDEPLPPETEARLGQFTELMATAVANTESRAEVERLADEQAALRRVATLVAQDVPSSELFRAVAREVGTLLGADFSGMIRYEDDAAVTPVAAWAAVGEHPPVPDRFRTEAGDPTTMIAETGAPARVDDWTTVPGPLAAFIHSELGVRCSVGTPIALEGRLWGALAVHSKQPGSLPPGTESRIAQFADLVAMAIANAEARAEVGRLAEEQAALRRIATLVAEGASPAAVFDAVAGEMEALLEADQVALNRFEPGAEILVLAHRGLDVARTPVGSRVSTEGESVTAAVRRTGRPARIENYEGAEGALAELARATGLRSSVAAPIVVEGQLWGLITASWKGEQSPLADTEERMARFAELLDTAIANAVGRAQLDASRARLVVEADEARRRVVRDLHDGAQQRMVHTIMLLKLAQRALRAEDKDSESLVAEALKQAERGNAELRELAHGILPSVLEHGGLRAGVRAVVARLDLPVRFDVTTERFPEEVEASAYFIVAEALTNVMKHSRAGRADVRASVENGLLHVEIRDDGVGGADPGGHGLVGMGDRVTALGGRLEIESPAGAGTLVAATLPISAG